MNFYIVCCWEEPLLFTYRSLWVGNMHTFKNYVVYITERPRARGKVKIQFYSSWAECLFSQIYKLNIFPSSLIFSFALQKLSCFRVFWKENISHHKLNYKLCYFWLKHMFDVSFSSFHKIPPFMNIFRLHFFKCSPLLTVQQYSTHWCV